MTLPKSKVTKATQNAAKSDTWGTYPEKKHKSNPKLLEIGKMDRAPMVNVRMSYMGIYYID